MSASNKELFLKIQHLTNRIERAEEFFHLTPLAVEDGVSEPGTSEEIRQDGSNVFLFDLSEGKNKSLHEVIEEIKDALLSLKEQVDLLQDVVDGLKQDHQLLADRYEAQQKAITQMIADTQELQGVVFAAKNAGAQEEGKTKGK